MNHSLGLNQDPSPQSPQTDSEAQPLEIIIPEPILDTVPDTLPARLALARHRLQHAAANGIKVLMYEVALDLDMSEFHFARQFRAAFGCSPHAYYDEVRAARARDLLKKGEPQGRVARLIRLRRPAELRDLLRKRQLLQGMADVVADKPSP